MISYKYNKQHIVAQSFIKAEYKVIGKVAAELQWVKLLFLELENFGTTHFLWHDNIWAIYLISSPVFIFTWNMWRLIFILSMTSSLARMSKFNLLLLMVRLSMFSLNFSHHHSLHFYHSSWRWYLSHSTCVEYWSNMIKYDFRLLITLLTLLYLYVTL